jgi:glutamate-1-semialdehyde 2,1-aminomutase
MNLNKQLKLWSKAKKIIPTGNNFYSKNPSRINFKDWPIYFTKAKGCKIWDLDGNYYYDFSYMGVGTNILGYSNSTINKKIIKSINQGNMSSLNSHEEVEFAKLILQPHTWAKMARFAKTGAEANSIAIRLSRAFNNKDKVIVCGYHGWHDWYLAANLSKKKLDTHLFPKLKTKGIPKILKNLTYSVDYNDLDSIKKIVENDVNISALIMEVERDKKPKKNYLSSIRKLCNKYKICLIFDECTTGFRETFGGLHLKYKINPDMAMFGKAISNGYSLTAVIGKKKIMESINKTFISSTFFSERTSYVAGNATLALMKKIKSWKLITAKGKQIKKKIQNIADKNKLKIEFSGLDALIKFKFINLDNEKAKKIIIKEMLKNKFLANDTIYVSISHTNNLIKKYIKNLDKSFQKISQGI